MGLLVEGKWQDQPIVKNSGDGRFVRADSKFRNWITSDGAAGPTGEAGFKAEAGRYHLYVSLACPWAHRTLIFRKLKQLDLAIDVSVVDWFMGENGWTFSGDTGSTGDPILGSEYLHQVYTAADPKFSGRVTVPVLWDKERATIVSNESSEIIRMFNSAFDKVGAKGPDYYPAHLRGAIDAINDRVYRDINNGVYRTGFATTQAAYDEAFGQLFAALDDVEEILDDNRYLVGDTLTEADWRLFTTLIRFDAVYVGHFKCNLRRIDDYPNLSNYLRELYQVPGVAETVNMEHIRSHYYRSHTSINPHGIIPGGPELDFTRPHNRDRLKAAA